MRNWSLGAVALTVVAHLGCGSADADLSGPEGLVALGPSYVSDAEVRRAALTKSLVDPSNGYATKRLANYGLSGGWDALPISNPPVRALGASELGAFSDPFANTAGAFAPVFDDEDHEWTAQALFELGESAFHNYPVEISQRFGGGFGSDSDADAVGYWRHENRVGGLVRVRTASGLETFASTCSTCHASTIDGQLVAGRTNAAFDAGSLARRLSGGHGSDWSPGLVDVTADGETNPAAITDLRTVAHQKRLHWAGSLYNSPAALAVRIETLLITSANEQMRPPREVALGLAYYLWSLGDAVETIDRSSPGADVYEQECATCHGYEEVAQPAVPLDMVGTDPAVGLSSTRGTGSYRVPSLRGVSSRSQLLHDGSVATLRELLDPARLQETPGHAFGTSLPAADREALLEFLHSI